MKQLMHHLLDTPENRPDTIKPIYQTSYGSGHHAESGKLEAVCFETENNNKVLIRQDDFF